MEKKSKNREIYFSFFMFTADLRPHDTNYTKILINHLEALTKMGYTGFDMHIASPTGKIDYNLEIENYKCLKEAFNNAGFAASKFNTNVGTTKTFDPTSPYKEQREQALAYLKSRVDITSILGGKDAIMSGPFLYPYGIFPITDDGEALWSDALQDWMKPRYKDAISIFQELVDYAVQKEVILAIEPIKNWESPPPNMVSEVLDFCDTIDESSPCGVALDTAQCVLESQGPSVFKNNIARAVNKNRLYYIHISAPDRGRIHDSWIPWDFMLGEIEPVYDGPYLIEVFNAIPPFESSMRMTRRRFWRPNEDPSSHYPSAYDIAESAIKELQEQLEKLNYSTVY